MVKEKTRRNSEKKSALESMETGEAAERMGGGVGVPVRVRAN